MCSSPSRCTHDYWIYAYVTDYEEEKKSIDPIRIGKWHFYASKAEVDKLWKIIQSATAGGKLGIASKVSTKLGASERKEKTHVICVYTRDLMDKEGVARVREALRKLGIRRKMHYKTDMQTLMENIKERKLP